MGRRALVSRQGWLSGAPVSAYRWCREARLAGRARSSTTPGENADEAQSGIFGDGADGIPANKFSREATR
jgi:hypothetical protein